MRVKLITRCGSSRWTDTEEPSNMLSVPLEPLPPSLEAYPSPAVVQFLSHLGLVYDTEPERRFYRSSRDPLTGAWTYREGE